MSLLSFLELQFDIQKKNLWPHYKVTTKLQVNIKEKWKPMKTNYFKLKW